MYNIHVYYTCIYLLLINILFRFGLLRNLFLKFESQGKNTLIDKDGIVDNKKHWYFLIEYLLTISGYSVGDLMLPVTTDLECHHATITAQLLGFMYFLVFEFLYHKNVYKGATGRSKFPQYIDAIQFFIDVATEEYDQCFAVNNDMIAAELVKQKTNILKFYK
jgi:hypothetical protein